MSLVVTVCASEDQEQKGLGAHRRQGGHGDLPLPCHASQLGLTVRSS